MKIVCIGPCFGYKAILEEHKKLFEIVYVEQTKEELSVLLICNSVFSTFS